MQHIGKILMSLLFSLSLMGCLMDDGAQIPAAMEGEGELLEIQGFDQSVEDVADDDGLSAEDVDVAGSDDPILAAASSSAIVYTNGTRAGEAWFNRGNPAFFDLYDAKCDSHPVYVEYEIGGGATQRFNNNDGCSQTVRKTLQSGGVAIRYRVCVNIQLAPDICSGYKQDFNP